MTDNFALEAVVSAAPYSNIHVRADNPEELADRLAHDSLAKALDIIRLLAAEGNLAEAGLKPRPVETNYEKTYVGPGDEPKYPNEPVPQQQSYARQKPTPQGGGQYPDRVYLDIPFSAKADRERAKGLGARFDGDKKQWYSTPKFSGENHEALVQEFGA